MKIQKEELNSTYLKSQISMSRNSMVVKKGQEAPVVAVFAGMRVQFYKGKGFTVRSSPPSKYYLDLDIPEVQEFRAKLCNPQTPTADLPCQQESSEEYLNPLDSTGIAQDLIESFRSIEQLKSLKKTGIAKN